MTEDMVAEGFAASLARSGGNITGISLLSPELDGKRQEILIKAVPGVRRIAAITDANVTPAQHLEALRDGADARGVELSTFGVTTPEKIVPAIDEARATGTQAREFDIFNSAFDRPIRRRARGDSAKITGLIRKLHWQIAQAYGK